MSMSCIHSKNSHLYITLNRLNYTFLMIIFCDISSDKNTETKDDDYLQFLVQTQRSQSGQGLLYISLQFYLCLLIKGDIRKAPIGYSSNLQCTGTINKITLPLTLC